MSPLLLTRDHVSPVPNEVVYLSFRRFAGRAPNAQIFGTHRRHQNPPARARPLLIMLA